MNNYFGNVLRSKVRDAQLTQRAVAQHLGVTNTSVYYWMSGRSTPTVENVVKLEKLLGCVRGELLVPLAYKEPAPLMYTMR